MYQEERILQILQALEARTTLSNQDIMTMFAISRDTARRDIIKLVDAGVAVRTHGGIILPTLRSELQTYRSRISQNVETKQRIIRHAATRLPESGLIFLDVSTTVEELCEYIPDDAAVFTHSIDNVSRLMEKKCEVTLLGGRLNRHNRFFAGGAAWSQLDGLHIDVAILGAAAVHKDGFYYSTSEDMEVKRKVVERADFVVIVADDSKFSITSRYRGAAFSEVDILVTNAMPPEKIANTMHKAGMVIDVPAKSEEEGATV